MLSVRGSAGDTPSEHAFAFWGPSGQPAPSLGYPLHAGRCSSELTHMMVHWSGVRLSGSPQSLHLSYVCSPYNFLHWCGLMWDSGWMPRYRNGKIGAIICGNRTTLAYSRLSSWRTTWLPPYWVFNFQTSAHEHNHPWRLSILNTYMHQLLLEYLYYGHPTMLLRHYRSLLR
jgi:hypothetical protein